MYLCTMEALKATSAVWTRYNGVSEMIWMAETIYSLKEEWLYSSSGVRNKDRKFVKVHVVVFNRAA